MFISILSKFLGYTNIIFTSLVLTLNTGAEKNLIIHILHTICFIQTVCVYITLETCKQSHCFIVITVYLIVIKFKLKWFKRGLKADVGQLFSEIADSYQAQTGRTTGRNRVQIGSSKL